jgi:hypothetical protein
MMRSPTHIINALAHHQAVWQALLSDQPADFIRWRPAPDTWNLLEIVGHLHDEECEDFRARVKHILTSPDQPMMPISPGDWVTSRAYDQQDYAEVVARFLRERAASVHWLQSLMDPDWGQTYQHAILGPITARQMLANWLAHDYFHIRQINRYAFTYLREQSGEDLTYAGNW